MRSSRLVALMLRLQDTGGATADRLAGELEVSVRTIYRDVGALQAAGVPLWTESGPGGGIRLVEGWRTRLDGLTADEATALLLGGDQEAAAEIGLGTVLAVAQTKVLATLPPELRSRAGRIRERFHLDAPGWFHHGRETVPFLPVVADALWADRRLDIRYRRRPTEAPVSRRVDPLGLVLKGGVWYLVARHRSDVRTYRVARIADATVRDERFERPRDFALGEHWVRSAREFDRAVRHVDVTIRLPARSLPRLRDVAGGPAVDDVLDSGPAPDDDGWTTVTIPMETEEVAAFQLLQLAPDVEVLAPAAVRGRLAAVAGLLMARNGDTGRRGTS